jgi:uncharacterized ferritin-like protein (DUF455 family)
VTTLAERAVTVLTAADPGDKVRLSQQAALSWRRGELAGIGRCPPPDRPARPDLPVTLAPKHMPRRRLGGPAGKLAMIHALAHIELNAIDLAWDIIARFADPALPQGFYDDWVAVAVEEAAHFAALAGLLADQGSFYGALPAHDGLWEAAEKTAHDLTERLAVIPMTLEARALDTAPATIARLHEAGETQVTAVLSTILADEIGHVAAGVRWFEALCRTRGDDPVARYQAIIRRHFPKGLKAPFNHPARARAAFPLAYWEPLA